MSVIITGIDMPTRCAECIFCIDKKLTIMALLENAYRKIRKS